MCSKLHELITRWANGTDDQLRLFEDDDEIIFERISNTVQLKVQMTQYRPDKSLLQTWVRPGCASLSHFHGALAQDPVSGGLWLVQSVQHGDGTGEKPLLDCLEAMLNQRDTWRAMFARLTGPTHKFTPTSLRSLPY